MTTVDVCTARPYQVKIGRGILQQIDTECVALLPKAMKILVVTDSNVAPLYLPAVSAALTNAGFALYSYVFPAGENSKNVFTFTGIVREAAKHGLCRDDAILALGGGVTGDLAGFAAASYMRGIRYVQVPTTLLAGIDSSIGGKTGFDLDEGKNLVGAFHQPAGVLFDIETLESLPFSEWKNGFGEAIKYAVLAGGRIAEIMLDGMRGEDTEELCALCAKYKADIVARDEKEGNLRQLLNLGHTIAHAEEKLSGYTVPHGEAVAAGIGVMARASYRAGGLTEEELYDVEWMLKEYELQREPLFPTNELVEAAANDKKAKSDGINVVEIVHFGDCRVRKMTMKEFGEYIG